MSTEAQIGTMPLERRCEACEGKGRIYGLGMYFDASLECCNCQGRGVVLTDDGTELLEFLKRHLLIEASCK